MDGPDLMLETAQSYAKRLAGYIASPTKIESLTRMEFGKAPPLHWIAAERGRIEDARKPAVSPYYMKLGNPELDGTDYAVPSLLPRAKPKPERKRDYIDVRAALPEPENPFLQLYSVGSRVIASVAGDFGVLPADIVGKRRHNHLVDARSVVAMTLKRWGRKSYPEIGKIIGGRDHSTVIHAVGSFDIYCRRNEQVWPSYQRHVKLIEKAEAEMAARAQGRPDAA